MRITISQAFSFCQQGGRDYQEDARYPDTDQVEASQRFFLVCDGVGGRATTGSWRAGRYASLSQ